MEVALKTGGGLPVAAIWNSVPPSSRVMVLSATGVTAGAVPVTVTAKEAVASGETPLAAVMVKWKVPVSSGMNSKTPEVGLMVK